ncbi:hypothetical protein EV121DRAFT_297405 [Schizophyllum commune]
MQSCPTPLPLTPLLSLPRNRILANSDNLKPARQLALIVRVLAALPEIVTGYWILADLVALQPRLSSRWLCNIAPAGEIISALGPKACLSLDAENAIPSPSRCLSTGIFPLR